MTEEHATRWSLVRLAGLPVAVGRLEAGWAVVAPDGLEPGADGSLDDACRKAVGH